MPRKRFHSTLLCLGFLVLLVPTSLNAGNLFKTAVSYDSGGFQTSSMAVGDLNGDGQPDVVLGNKESNSVSILLGNSDGTFRSGQSYDFGYPSAIAIADINGDHKPDVLVAMNYFYATVGVFLGNGDGTFQEVEGLNPGASFLTSVATGDVNGDGKADVLFGSECCNENNGDGGLGVLLGNGDGTFQPAVVYDSGGAAGGPYGEQGISVAVADVNGDHKLDLVTGNAQCSPQVCYYGTVGVLLGNGDGTFQSVQSYNLGAWGTASVVVGDVNGDGRPDIATVSVYGDQDVGVLVGNGDGTFQSVKSYVSGENGANAIAIADVNRDGKLDLVVSDSNMHNALVGSASVFLGNGDGTFQKAQIYKSGGDFTSSIAVADVTRDGKLDLLLASRWYQYYKATHGSVGVLRNNFFATTTSTLTSSPNPSVFGQSVTLRASVVSKGLDMPTGKVIFRNGSNAVGSAMLSAGVAQLKTTKLPVGSLSLTAVYKGDNFSAKSTSQVIVQVVNPSQ